jgi:hypothetical protein
LNTQKYGDLFARSLNKPGIMNYFHKENPMDTVHGRWTTVGSHGPPWTSGGTDRRALGHGGALTGARPLATLGHGSSPVVDVSYAALQAHRIVNVALYREYSPGIVFIFSQRRKDLYHV